MSFLQHEIFTIISLSHPIDLSAYYLTHLIAMFIYLHVACESAVSLSYISQRVIKI